ncbi:MAG TPA: ABC transporter permease [Anaerolineae bacterium]|nr:ABC transporter permease [Anaerolineae bacterium]
MNLWQTVQVAWEGIAVNKVRSFLTMLGIIIGVSAVIIMMAVSAGTEATIADRISGLGSNLIMVSRGFGGERMGPQAARGMSQGLSYADALAIREQVGGISGVVAEQMAMDQVVRADSATIQTDVIGAMPDFPHVRGVELADGRFFTQEDLDRKAKVAVLAYTTAQDLFGDADPIGQSITAGSVRLTVVGVMYEKGLVGQTDYDQRVYVPLTVAFQRFSFSRRFGDMVMTVYVQAESQDTIDNVITQIEALLRRRHELTAMDEADFTIYTQGDIIETQEATTEAFRSLLAWVAGVSLLVGGIGIMNIMLVSVTERTREIGIRQAVGAAPSDIRLQFLVEALVLSLMGGLIGVGAGVGGSWLFGRTSDMRTVVVLQSILLAFCSAAAVGIFFGFFPANRASQLDPIEALRHE